MSLEAALQANTSAIHALIAALGGAPAALKQAVGEAAQAAADSAKPTKAKPEPAAAASAAPTFESIKGPFVALVNANRAAAAAILEQFKIAKLSDAKAEQYAGILAAIQQAS